MNRREFLAGAAAAALRPSLDTGAGESALRNAAASRGLLYGAATSTGQLHDADFAAALVRESAILVPEYEMKRGVIEAVEGRYDFSGADALAGFAQRHGLKLRGHPLVWHKRNPDWLTGRRGEADLTGFVTAMAARYRGRIHSWDVVNEAIDITAPGNLRRTVWLESLGPSYVDLAFHAARAADPDALLVYNDWGCELGAADNDRFRAATLDFLEGLRARGVPVDGYGMQGHLGFQGAQVDQAKLRMFAGRVRAMGLKILVTEHDVDDDGGPDDPAARDRLVADTSRRFLDVMLDNAATAAVLTWGLSDRYLDPPGWKQRLAGWLPRRLPLDSALARKPMWQAMHAAFAG
ncbi:MAG: endo-1,4-beta-xylanase [Rhizomicrobium sp.]